MAWSQLKHLPVQAQNGTPLGHVEGFVFDPETHAILQYEVRHGSPLSRKTLLVGTAQVVSISATVMVVEDNAAAGVTHKSERVPAAETTVTTLASTRKIS